MDVTLTAPMLTLIPVIMALVSLVKIYMDSYWSPLVSLVIGFVFAYFLPADTAGQVIMNGLILGASAAGVYSGVKTMVK